MQRSQWRQKTCHSSCPQHDTYSFGLYLLLQHQEMQNRSKVAVPHRSNENGASHHMSEHIFHVTCSEACAHHLIPSIPSTNWTSTFSFASRHLIITWTESWEQDCGSNLNNRNQIQALLEFFAELPRWLLRNILKKNTCSSFPCRPSSGRVLKYFANWNQPQQFKSY